MSQAALALPGKLSPERVDPFTWRSHRLPAGRARVEAKVSSWRRRAKFAALLAIVVALLALGTHAGRLSPYVQPILTSLTLPWTSSPVRVENVTSRLIDDGRTLLVEGTVVNISGRGLNSPALKLAIRAADNSEIFVWTARPADAHLAPDGRTRFSSHLAAPPNGGVEVAVALQPPGG